jgi:NADH-quinone oxidoreductase subunit N
VIPVTVDALKELIPYGVLTLGSITVLLLSLLPASRRTGWVPGFCSAATVLASAAALLLQVDGQKTFGEFLLHDRLGFGFAMVLAVLSIFVTPIFKEPENLSLLLLSVTGALLMIYANHLLVFFVGLELLSLPLYILVGVGKDQAKGSEAAFKYFLLGAISSALYVYGVALLWGTLGTMEIDKLGKAVSYVDAGNAAVVATGAALVLSAVAFKMGLVPFHMWLPDVYEGAPSSVVAWMAGAVKVSVIPFALRLLSSSFVSNALDWTTPLVLISVVSMIWGSFAGVFQTDMKRMLAYSTIAHAGYGVIGFLMSYLGEKEAATNAMVYYFLTYGIASVACFVIVSLEESSGHTSISHFSGLARRKPILALILALSLLSLAGIPPLGGFFAKFNLFMIATHRQHIELVVVGVLTSVVSLGYYLRVIVAMYMREPDDSLIPAMRWSTGTLLGVVALLTILFGIFPSQAIGILGETGFQFFR